MCYISEELTTSQGYNASVWLRQIAKHIQGGGGGQAFLALQVVKCGRNGCSTCRSTYHPRSKSYLIAAHENITGTDHIWIVHPVQSVHPGAYPWLLSSVGATEDSVYLFSNDFTQEMERGNPS